MIGRDWYNIEMAIKRVDIKAILANPKLRKELLDRAVKSIIEVMRWG